MASIKEFSNLQGRRALLTGALGGLGQVMAHTLAELGADLILVDRPGSDFKPLESALKQWQIKVKTAECDLEFENERGVLIRKIQEDGQGLSILINNAAFVGTSGLSGWAVPFEQQTIETWRRALEVNLTAVFELCQGFAPILRQSPGANVINISSIYGILGPDLRLYDDTNLGNPAAYASSKGGVIQLTRWLSTALAPAVRVNSITPGGVWRNQNKAFVDRYESRTPLKRMAEPTDFIGPLAFLATDQARYVTGHNLVVDGGWSAW